MAIKMNKMQIEAICEKIKGEARKIIINEEIRLGKQFAMTPEQQIRYDDAVEMDRIIKEYNERYKDECDEHVCWHWKSCKADSLFNKFKSNWVDERLPKFDFSSLKTDIIVSTLEVDSPSELIENALSKYRIN